MTREELIEHLKEGMLFEVSSGNEAWVRAVAHKVGPVGGRIALSTCWKRCPTEEEGLEMARALEQLLGGKTAFSTARGPSARRIAQHYVSTGLVADPMNN